jgi:hypothetical protein
MKRLISVLVLFVLLFGAAATANAQGNNRAGLVAFGRDIVVQAGEVVVGDVVAFGGSITVEPRARVNGNVIAFGGNVRSAGEVDLSVVTFGGEVDLLAGSLVRHDVVTLGGAMHQAEGARVQGNISRGFMFDSGGGPNSRSLPLQPLAPIVPRPWAGDLALSIVMGLVVGTLKLVGLTAVAVVIVAIFPRQIAGVKATIIVQPGASAGVGFLTYLAAIALTVPLLLTCIGNFLMWPGLIVATTFGIGALGLLLGERLVGAGGGQQRSTTFNAALGTGLIVLVLLVLGAVPFVACFTWVFWVMVASLATGAVVLSKFGTQIPASVSAPPLMQAAAASAGTPARPASVSAPLEAPGNSTGEPAKEVEQ